MPTEKGYDDKYYDFFTAGWSDCASFASHTLWAGGIRDLRYGVEITDPTTLKDPEVREELGIRYNAPFWHRDVWKDKAVFFTYGDPYQEKKFRLDLSEWYQTDPLLSFLKTNNTIASISEYSGEIPQFVETGYDSDTDGQAWNNFLVSNRSSILPGDLIFYRWGNYSHGKYTWDHVSIVMRWGRQTYYNEIYSGSFDSCGTNENLLKPRVVERTRRETSSGIDSPIALYNQWGPSRSIDNTQFPINTFAKS